MSKNVLFLIAPILIVPGIILLLYLLGLLDMGNRILFSYGMLCYFAGQAVCLFLCKQR